jgi:YfiH family protein
LDIVKVEAWNRYSWLRHGFSTRHDGVSQVYGQNELNLGWTKEDDPKLVAANRQKFVSAFFGDEDRPVLVGVRQIHSDIVRVVERDDGALRGRLQTTDGRAILEGDGLITDVPGLLLGVGTADCVPVFVVDVEKRVIGAFHAGWRGTVGRIVEQGVVMMTDVYRSHVEDLVAAVGPSIGSCCYSVGDEVRTHFASQFGYADELFRSGINGDGIHLDLWRANRLQLLNAGLAEARITVIGECTACTRSPSDAPRYFSHRGEKGLAGRMLNVVGIADEPIHPNR